MGNKVIITEEDGTTSQKGVSLLSDDPKTITGTDSTSNVTPSSLKAKLGTQDVGKIAIGAGVSEIIKWAQAQSSDSSINITYDPDANTLDFKATSSGDVRSICLSENPGFTEGVEFAEPVCIIPTADGELNFTADPPIILTPTANGLNISFSGSGSGIQTINTIAPDGSDDFKITATLPYIFEPITNGINLKDNGSIPYTYTTSSDTVPFVNNNISFFVATNYGEFFRQNNSIGLRINEANYERHGLSRLANNREVLNGDNDHVVTTTSLRAILGVLTANTVLISTGRETAITNSSVGTAGMPFISKGGTGLPDFGGLVSNDGTIAINYDSNTHTINLSTAKNAPITWITVMGTTQQMMIQNGYINNTSSLCTYILPINANVGQEVILDGLTGSWIVTQNAGQSMIYGTTTTTVGIGGSFSSYLSSDSIKLRCIVANIKWKVIDTSNALKSV